METFYLFSVIFNRIKKIVLNWPIINLVYDEMIGKNVMNTKCHITIAVAATLKKD